MRCAIRFPSVSLSKQAETLFDVHEGRCIDASAFLLSCCRGNLHLLPQVT